MSGHSFSRIPRANIQRSVFDRSHGVKTTFNSGFLVPVFVDEVLPGDTFNLKVNLFCRLTTPIVPFMDNLYLDSFFFYVPTRILWDNFEKFMGEQVNPGDSTDYLIPTHTANNVPSGENYLWDYLGLPTEVNQNITVNSLPFRAYYRIFNEWFRDENLVKSSEYGLKTDDGPDYGPGSAIQLCQRCKRHDYFTSALPWPQKGPGVEIGLSGLAPVVPLSASEGSGGNPSVPAWSGATMYYGYGIEYDESNNVVMQTDDSTFGSVPANVANTMWNGKVTYSPSFGLDGDARPIAALLTGATAVTINSLRQAFQLQKFYEKDARGGTRYTEILRSHFGVISPDARLQRPEYLGGSSSRIAIKPVEQTSATDTTSPQGNLAAYGVGGDNYHGFTKSFVEHGYIIGLVNVRADLNYQQGINRMWSREVREDFYWPTFAHLGEQAILNKEIYAQGTAADEEVFGYQERYAEYRYKPSLITGKFRSSNSQTLDMWHLAQDFESLPTLSEAFINEKPPVERVVAVQNEPQFLLDAWFDLKCVRPMPVFGVPGLVDHF